MALEPSDRAALPVQSQSLYRKYRPRSFEPDQFVGQEHIARTLRNAIVLDRVAHAYLFCGPRGTGKTSTARLLAKAVNCLDPDPDRRPCNECEACRAINAGSAVDIIEIDAASNRGVDDIRDLREKVKYAPTQLRVKFYIIDEAHQLTRDAFNAFLKTLEEPPAHVKFVLATTEPDKLPDTVASRCQRFDFRRFSVSGVVEHLSRVSRAEGLEVEDEALRLIARQSTGSMRDALGLLEQLALFGEPVDGRIVVTADAVRRVVGLSRNDRLVALVGALASKDVAAGLATIGAATEAGEDIHQLNRQLVAYLRTLLLLRAGGRADEADGEAQALAEQFSLAELAALVRTFSSIEGALNKGSYAQLPLELAFVEAIVGVPQAPSEPAVAEPPRRTAAPPTEQPPAQPARASERRIAPEPSPIPRRREPAAEDVRQPPPPPPTMEPRRPASRPAPRPTPAVAAGSLLERLVSSWSQIRREVKVANSPVAALLSSAEPCAVSGDQVVLISPYEFHRNRLNDDVARRIVEDVLSRQLGGDYRLTCVAPEDAPTGDLPSPAQDPPMEEPPPPAANLNGSGTHAEAQDQPTEASTVQPAAGPAPDLPEGEEPATDESDERRVRAAKAIFGAEEVEPS